MSKKTLEDIDVKGKKVFVRADFNVPLDDQQRITDDKRIRATLPTIEYLLSHGAAVILASHLGRPKGTVKEEMSLRPVAARLTELLKKPVVFVEDCVGEKAEKAAAKRSRFRPRARGAGGCRRRRRFWLRAPRACFQRRYCQIFGDGSGVSH